MKTKLLLYAFCVTTFLQAQTTLIPDPNFEQALIDLGHDDVIDGQVVTTNINGLLTLDVSNENISDLTGIQDFIALEELRCYGNQLNALDVSNNNNLTVLACNNNFLTSLDVSNNTALINLNFSQNSFGGNTIDLSNLSLLQTLT